MEMVHTVRVVDRMIKVGVIVCAMGVGAGCSTSAGSAADGGAPVVRGPVHVSVLDASGNGRPAAGTLVVFMDPSGAVASTATTDANGAADGAIGAGGSVTAVVASSSSHQMTTTLGVQPGDSLVIGPAGVDQDSVGTFTASWTAAPGNPVSYDVYGPCGLVPAGDQLLQRTITISHDCQRDPMELLVVAKDASGSVLFNDATGIPFVAGNSAVLADGWSSGMTFDASYTGLQSVDSIEAARFVVEPSGFSSSASVATTGMLAAQVALAGPASMSSGLRSVITGPLGASQTLQQMIASAQSTVTTMTIDAGSALLPWIGEPVLTTGGFLLTKDTTGTSSDTADLLQLDASWSRGGVFFHWTVYGPDALAVGLPSLPAAAGQNLLPTQTDVLHVTAVSYEADTLAGYDAVRGNVGAAISGVFQSAHASQAALTRVNTSATSSYGTTNGGW